MPRPSRIGALLTALTAAGGVAPYADLAEASSPAAVRAATHDGLIARVGHGLYAFTAVAAAPPTPARSWARWNDGPDDAESAVLLARQARARGLAGALSHRCAAAHHGWPILTDPDIVEVAVPPGRHRPVDPSGVHLTQADLTPEEIRTHVTSPLRTVIDCARTLPTAQALAVADSALRAEAVGPRELAKAGATATGRHASRVRHVAVAADGGAANPFESALRAAVLGLPGLVVETQVPIGDSGFEARVDLADRAHRIVLEADSYEFHGSRERFAEDRRRYAELTARGWAVLPFGFEDVTTRPNWVRSTVEAVLLFRRT